MGAALPQRSEVGGHLKGKKEQVGERDWGGGEGSGQRGLYDQGLPVERDLGSAEEVGVAKSLSAEQGEMRATKTAC